MFGEQFLERDGIEKIRSVQQSSGIITQVIDFAGGPYVFHGLSAGQHEQVKTRFESWLTDVDDNAKAVTTVRQVTDANFRQFEMAGREITVDLDWQRERIAIAGRKFLAEFTVPTAPGEPVTGVIWTCITAGAEFQGVFENYFRTLVAYRLLLSGGMLLHSSGVVTEKGTFLFFGRSGAGKSTLAKRALGEGYEVLSDDMNALVPKGKYLTVERLPFAGDLQNSLPSQRCITALRGLVALDQGGSATATALSSASAIARLLVCAPFVNQDPFRAEVITGSLMNIVKQADVVELEFALTDRFSDIDKAVERSYG